MNLREYQAKQIFSDNGITIPSGKIAQTSEEVERISHQLNCPVVIKPQLGIKKRGKLGIISFANSPLEAAQKAEQLFSRTIKGERIKTILVEEKANIEKELYLAVAVDYSRRCPMIIISKSGGIDIEEVAKNEPENILKIPINIITGPQKEDYLRITEFIDQEISEIIRILYSIFRKYDAEMLEINPLVRTNNNKLIAVDAVLNINDSSLFRHEGLAKFKQQINNIDPISEEANNNSWTYIDLPGDIAILSSGAGLTMTILDLINHAGGSAANFLDTAQIDEEGIFKAFELLNKAKEPKAMLINIFAGLNRCDKLADGIIDYLKINPMKIPIVVRMIGNKEEIGHKILKDSGIDPYTDLEKAIEHVVQLSNKQEKSK